MFDLGFQEIIIVLAVALIFIGPKHLPAVARTLGRAMGELRRAGDELRAQINLEAMMAEREEEERLNPSHESPFAAPDNQHQPQPSFSADTETEVASTANDQDQGQVPQKTET
ncbi:MAG: Sec-independent protein translocase subunit TatA/TatB [Thermodesulfobacteriota bacterium]